MTGHIASACGICGSSIEVRDTRKGRKDLEVWRAEHAHPEVP